jgi:DMSO/TMAO reductase YedYZ molybdopterin-dependent catalytic subunit
MKGEEIEMISTSLNIKQTEALWKKAAAAGIPRDEFLANLNSQGAAAVLDECAKKGVIASTKPARAEMPFELMADQEYYTPNAAFFTFCHASPPKVDVKNWRLSIEGDGVENPFTLTYDDLLKLPSKTFTRYLECAGNGRSFYETLLKKKAMGSQWHFGGYGIAEWTGVPLGELLKRAKVKSSAVEVMPVGIDNPPGERPLPISKAIEEDSLLVYLMNNEILPVDHGFPVRAFLPGWVGVASVKWVGKLVVSTQPLHVITNTTSYVLIGPDYAPQPPAKGPVISKQFIKSACCLPWPATLKAGEQKITGYAWSPDGKISKVDVSLDGGKTFQSARLIGPNIEKAGSRWEYTFNAKPGPLTITPSATDERGNTQYDLSQQKWNQLGYLFGAMVPHLVTVN